MDGTLSRSMPKPGRGLVAITATGGSMAAGGVSGVVPSGADCARLGSGNSASTAPAIVRMRRSSSVSPSDRANRPSIYLAASEPPWLGHIFPI